MLPISMLTDQEFEERLKTVTGLMKKVKNYLWGKVYTGEVEMDYNKVHTFLEELDPYTDDPDAPPALLSLVARLYFEETRYQEAAKLFQRANDPQNYNTLGNIDFYNSYYAGSNNWKGRQERIWGIFQKLDLKLRKASNSDPKAIDDLMVSWLSCFPTQELTVIPPAEQRKGTICLGLPDGIFSLHPFLYLLNHVPAKVAKNWDITLEASDYPENVCFLIDQLVPADQVHVDISFIGEFKKCPQSRDDTNVVLGVWHPHLKELTQAHRGHEAMVAAINCVNANLPLSARLLYVDYIALADIDPTGRSFPIPELRAQFEARNMTTSIPLDQVLERRRRKYTREPIRSPRPRADITRGETAMPELEEMYFQRKEDHLIAMQRYGTGAWFLVIPRGVCEGNFQQFREALENAAHNALGDEICFVGWAEGTKNYYIDLITVCGGDVLNFFASFFREIPACESIRCSTFYWNSDLHTFNYITELAKMAATKFNGPVKELVNKNMRTALEKMFLATRWERPDIPMPNLPEGAKMGQVSGDEDDEDPADLLDDEDENNEDEDEYEEAYDDEDGYHFDPREFIEEDPQEIFGDLLGGFIKENESLRRQTVANQASGANLGGTTRSQSRHVHNTKRKGLSRKKDKNKRKKKK